mmetsp:Transcript_88933/g.272387  ORF Transcript_88933/g.272387 Transcript_88933/m.272387 type:complete len:763 (-) Transcript_88933:54-2342(-)
MPCSGLRARLTWLAVLCVAVLAELAASEQNVTSTSATSSEKAGSAAQSPTARLFNTLLVTFIAVFMGFAVVRAGIIEPDSGEMKGMGYFVGQLCFPLLIFNTVATAKLGDVDFGILLACGIGKGIVMLATWLIIFVSYMPSRSTGQRFLTATVFAFFAISSNDFAIGFPVIDALYGKTINMAIYITGNAVIGSVFYVPLTFVLFAIGKSLQAQDQQDSDGAEPPSCFAQVLKVVQDILFNPVIAMSILGFVYKLVFGFTLVDDGMKLHLPSPLSNFVTLVTSPFGMCALFMTGTNLRTFSLSLWPMLLVFMKVFICAYATYALAGVFVSRSLSASLQVTLQNFAFLYGMIPTSSAPLIFAQQYDAGSASGVATAILLGLVFAGPMMFAAALFLEDANENMTDVIVQVQFTINVVSLVCGAVFFALTAVVRYGWATRCPQRMLVLGYAITLVMYEAVMIVFNPQVRPASCQTYNQHFPKNYWVSMDTLGILVSFFQNATVFMVIAMQMMANHELQRPGRRKPRASLPLALCFVAAVLPSFVTMPFTINEMCSQVDPAQPGKTVWPNAILCYILFITMVLLAIQYVVLHRTRRAARRDMAVADDSSASEGDKSGDEHDSDDEVDAGGGDAAPSDRSLLKNVAHGLIFFLAIRLFIRVINTSQVIAANSVMGSFAQMLVVESVLEHGQLPILIALMFSDSAFPHELSSGLKQLPWISRVLQMRVRTAAKPGKAGDDGKEYMDEDVDDREEIPSPEDALGSVARAF